MKIEKVIKAAKRLKRYCNETECKECIFDDHENLWCCKINSGESPNNWILPKGEDKND